MCSFRVHFFQLAHTIRLPLKYPRLQIGYQLKKVRYYVLPDGRTVDFSEADIHKCGEAFLGSLGGIHRCISDAVRGGRDSTATLSSSSPPTVLAGGSTMMTGFVERVRKEIGSSSNIIAPDNRNVSSSLGAAMWASLTTHDYYDQWITQSACLWWERGSMH